jgi:ABC-type antimicrobial peptide transport system permease subunit
MIRTAEPPARIERAIRDAVSRVNRNLPVPRLIAESDIVAQSNAKARVFTQLLTLFGAFAVLLASIGLYGITAYSVARRTSEFGVRLAVGAQPTQVLWLVLRQVVIVAGVGLAIGIPASLAAGRTIRSLLFGVVPESVSALASAALVLLAVAVVAGLVPAWRAARLDPLAALRAE